MSFFGMFNNTTTTTKGQDSDYDHVALPPNTNIGENGTVQLTEKGVGDIRLVFFSSLCRGATDEKLNTLFEQYYAAINEDNKVEMICDLFTLMFEKRDCRGGEGEKKLFFDMFTRIEEKYSDFD